MVSFLFQFDLSAFCYFFLSAYPCCHGQNFKLHVKHKPKINAHNAVGGVSSPPVFMPRQQPNLTTLSSNDPQLRTHGPLDTFLGVPCQPLAPLTSHLFSKQRANSGFPPSHWSRWCFRKTWNVTSLSFCSRYPFGNSCLLHHRKMLGLELPTWQIFTNGMPLRKAADEATHLQRRGITSQFLAEHGYLACHFPGIAADLEAFGQGSKHERS